MISRFLKHIYINSNKEINVAKCIIHSIINNTIDDEIIEMVKNINFYYISEEKKTILMYACEYSKPEIINILINNKYADVGYYYMGKFFSYLDYDRTALMYACEHYNNNNNNYNMEMAILNLIETGLTNLNIYNWCHDTALILACKNNITSVALKLIEINKSLAGAVNVFGFTPLIYACKNNNTILALKLIKTNKANINKFYKINCDSNFEEYYLGHYSRCYNALIYALKNNMDTIITELLKMDKNNELKLQTKMFIKQYKFTEIDNKLL